MSLICKDLYFNNLLMEGPYRILRPLLIINVDLRDYGKKNVVAEVSPAGLSRANVAFVRVKRRDL